MDHELNDPLSPLKYWGVGRVSSLLSSGLAVWGGGNFCSPSLLVCRGSQAKFSPLNHSMATLSVGDGGSMLRPGAELW